MLGGELMSNYKDITGQRFGRLVALHRLHNTKGKTKWLCVCDERKDDFQAFYDWSMNNGYDENLSIDRVNNNGNYEPNNCRWATPKQQNRNSRHVKKITIDGVTRCLSEWCDILGLNIPTVQTRFYNLGWSIEKSLLLEVTHD